MTPQTSIGTERDFSKRKCTALRGFAMNFAWSHEFQERGQGKGKAGKESKGQGAEEDHGTVTHHLLVQQRDGQWPGGGRSKGRGEAVAVAT